MQAILEFGSWLPTKSARTLHPHRNPGLELVFVARGTATWDYDGRVVPAPMGSVTYTWPWETHGAFSATVPSAELFWVVLALDRVYRERPQAFSLHAELGLSGDANRRVCKLLDEGQGGPVAASAELANLLPALVDELSAPGLFKEERVTGLAKLSLVELGRCLAGYSCQRQPTSAENRVRQFLAELSARCGELWTLSEMAACCCLGRSQFAKIVKQQTGDTPMRLLNRLRVEQAKVQLAAGKSVTATADACGFTTTQYFATVFASYTGCAPSAWKESGTGGGASCVAAFSRIS